MISLVSLSTGFFIVEPFFDTASFKTSDFTFGIKGENAFFIDTLQLEKSLRSPYALGKTFTVGAVGTDGVMFEP